MHSRHIIVSLFGILLLAGFGCGSSSSTSSDGSLWSSKDSGETWSQLAALPSASGVGSIAGVNVSSIEIDPSDESVYYMGTATNGLFYSYDYGTSWSRPENPEITNGNIIDISVDSTNICTIYALKPGELLKSNTCARDWEMVYAENREKEELTAFALDWYDPTIMWLGTSSGEVFKSTDSGETWAVVYRIDDYVTDLLINSTDSRQVLVATAEDGVSRTADHGETWEELEDELQKNFSFSQKTYGLAQDDDGEVVIINTKYGLLRSTDFASSWEELNLLTAPGDERIYAFTVDPNDANRIFYSTESVFYATEDGGVTWRTEDLPSQRPPSDLVVHRADGTRILTGFSASDD